jgi:hypothetical protein
VRVVALLASLALLVPLRASGRGYSSARAAALVTGFANLLPVAVSPGGGVLVATGCAGRSNRISAT